MNPYLKWSLLTFEIVASIVALATEQYWIFIPVLLAVGVEMFYAYNRR
jgi:hypothetical protein